MENGNIFNENLVAISLGEPDRERAIRALAKLLSENDYVKDSYLDAVLEREKEFPTGLSTEPFGVALPHTDCEHVKEAGIAVGILPNPAEFHAMDDPDEIVEVRLIFLMAIRESGMMVEILQKLAEIFQKPDVLKQLSAAADPSRVVQILKSQLNEVTM